MDVETEPEFRAGPPRFLFETSYPQDLNRDYDVAPDGERFLVIAQDFSADDDEQIHVVVNWLDELKERVPIE